MADASVAGALTASAGQRYELVCLDDRPFSPGRPGGPGGPGGAAGRDAPRLMGFREEGDGNPLALNWKVSLEMRPRAMIHVGGRLVLGDMSDEVHAADPHRRCEGRGGGIVLSVSPVDGSAVSRHSLESPPVWDGMAAANGRVYASAMDGRVVCFGGGHAGDDRGRGKGHRP